MSGELSVAKYRQTSVPNNRNPTHSNRMQQSRLRFLVLVAFMALLRLNFTAATCGECYNAHACIGKNQFQVCVNGVRDTSQNFTCASTSAVCTRYGFICLEESATIKPACGDTSQCGNCAVVDNFRFTCLSRTTFTQCFNDETYGAVGTCPDSTLCSVSGAASGTPCVKHCSVDEDSDICDRNADNNNGVTDVPTDSTTQSSSSSSSDSTTQSSSSSSSSTSSTVTTVETTTVFAPTPTTITPATPVGVCVAGAGRYAITNDTVCTSYVNCYWRNDVIQNIVVNCPARNPYFNATSTVCGTVKPTGVGCV